MNRQNKSYSVKEYAGDIIFQQKEWKSKWVHVMVHGFLADSERMRSIAKATAEKWYDVLCLGYKTNTRIENITEGIRDKMYHYLADERYNGLEEISWTGHSMGSTIFWHALESGYLKRSSDSEQEFRIKNAMLISPAHNGCPFGNKGKWISKLLGTKIMKAITNNFYMPYAQISSDPKSFTNLLKKKKDGRITRLWIVKWTKDTIVLPGQMGLKDADDTLVVEWGDHKNLLHDAGTVEQIVEFFNSEEGMFVEKTVKISERNWFKRLFRKKKKAITQQEIPAISS